MGLFVYQVTIDCDTWLEARRVAAERLGADEDYGFDYRLDYDALPARGLPCDTCAKVTRPRAEDDPSMFAVCGECHEPYICERCDRTRTLSGRCGCEDDDEYIDNGGRSEPHADLLGGRD